MLPAAPASLVAAPSPRVVKIAILENLKIEKLSTDKYAKDYMDGLDVAADEALAMGYQVEFKTFFYGKEPLAILDQVPAVKTWNPDVVIGPRSSSLFLMLKGQFDDRLVLSPFATANEVSALPSNFYSLTLPNEFFTRAVVNLVAKRFTGRAVAPIIELDCKNCQDFADGFEAMASKSSVKVRPRASFLSKAAESSDLSSLLKEHATGDLVLLPNTSYTSGTLIARIADHLKTAEPTFIGGDGWGDWTSSYVGKVKSQYAYIGYRVTPWSIDATDARTRAFREKFRAVKKAEATGPASLLAYVAVMAPLKAHSARAAAPTSGNTKAEMLAAFRDAVKATPNFSRPTEYAVYKVTQQGEEYVGSTSAVESKE